MKRKLFSFLLAMVALLVGNVSVQADTVGIEQVLNGTTFAAATYATMDGVTVAEAHGTTLNINQGSKTFTYDGTSYTAEKTFRKTVNSSTWDATQWCGYTIEVPVGKKMTLTNVKATMWDANSNASYTWRIVVENASGTALYTSDSKKTTASAHDALSVADPNLVDLPAGTYTVKMQVYQGGSNKYFVIPYLTVDAALADDNSATYDITTSAGVGGTVAPASCTVTEGSEVVLNATPNTGYKFVSWTVDGETYTDNPYTISNVTANHTAEATFAALQKVEFVCTDTEVSGSLPTNLYFDGKGNVSIPTNQTLYKEGYTLAYWVDADDNQYQNGRSYTFTEDKTLTPYFAKNTVSLADITEPTEVTWQFGRSNGAPDINGSTPLVTQVTIAGETVDMTISLDADGGKWNNTSRTDDLCQVNNGSHAYLAAVPGTVIQFACSYESTTTTVAGAAISEMTATTENSRNVYTYTYTGSESKITIAIGDGSYYSYVKAIYPAPVATPIIAAQLGTTSYATITCATDGATLYYTTDGTDPVAGVSNEYKEKLTFNEAATVKAIAVKEGLPTSKVAEKAISILAGDLKTVAYVYNSGYSTYCGVSKDPIYAALAQHDTEYNLVAFDCKGVDAEKVTDLKEYDVVVSTEANTGSDAYGIALKSIVGEVPMLNLKTFYYGSGRWEWGTAANPTKKTSVMTVKDNTLALFNGLVFNGNEASLFNASSSSYNLLQTTSGVTGYTSIATADDADVIFGNEKFLSIGLSYDDIVEANSNATTLVENAVALLLEGADPTTSVSATAYPNIVSVTVIGEALTAKQLAQLADGEYTKTIAIQQGIYPEVVATSNVKDADLTVAQPSDAVSKAVITLKSGENVIKELTLPFVFKIRNNVEKKLYDFVVPDDGTLAEAIDAANNRADATTRYRIFVKQGDYTLPLGTGTVESAADKSLIADPKTYITKSNISIIGEDMDNTFITNSVDNNQTFTSDYGEANIWEGIGKGDVLYINGGVKDTYLQDIKLYANTDDGRGRMLALQDRGDRSIYKNVNLWAYQDTYTTNNQSGRFYYEGGVLRGRTDYICGKGDVWMEKVTIRQVKGGYFAVPSVPKQYGYIMNECTIIGDATGVDGTYTLGRPWGSGTPIAIFKNCTFNVKPSTSTGGWSDMSGGWPKQFAAYGSVDSNGNSFEPSTRTIWEDKDKVEHENVPTLTDDEADALTIETVMGSTDGWEPNVLCEQVDAPVVELDGKVLSWADKFNALLYAIVKDDKVIAFTTEPTYTVTDEGEYAVRAANEMGGLGEASAKVTVSNETGVKEVSAATVAKSIGKIYNLAGQQVSKSYRGYVIKDGKKVLQ